MVTKCPVCKSSRIRRGYRSTPFWSKVIFLFNLLCDNCNWEFAGFALPWTIPSKTTKRSKVKNVNSEAVERNPISDVPEGELNEEQVSLNAINESEDKIVSESKTDIDKSPRKNLKKKIKHRRLSES